MNERAAVATNQSPTQAKSAGRILQRKCACGRGARPDGECAECRRKRLQRAVLQPKLVIHQPGDRFEREADRAAAAVMMGERPMLEQGAALQSAASPALQREHCAGAVASDHASEDGQSETAAQVDRTLEHAGRPLEPATRRWMEQRFDHNFGQVRVHDDEQAQRSAQAVNARAYTVGADVVFAASQYAPATQEGQGLLAHELAHVVQQAHAPAQTPHLQRAPWGTCPTGHRLDARSRLVNFPAELFAVGYYYSKFPNHCILTNEMLAAGEAPQCKEPERTMVEKLMRHFHRDKRPQRRRSVQSTENVTERAEGAGTALQGAVEMVQTLLQPDILDVTAQQVYDVTTTRQANTKRRKIKNVYVPRLDMVTGGHWAAGHTLPAPTGFGLQWRISGSKIVCFGPTDFASHPGVIQYVAVDTSKKQPKKKSTKKRGGKVGKQGGGGKTGKKSGGAQPGKKPAAKKPSRKPGAPKPNPTNKGIGISILSTGEGGANAGIGVSILSNGVAVATAGVGVSIGSNAMAAGAAGAGVSIGDTAEGAAMVGAGVSKGSQSSVVGGAGVGVSKESKVEGAGVAGAGVAEKSETEAAAAAGAGKIKNVRGKAIKQAGAGDVKDVEGGSQAAPGAKTPPEAEAGGEQPSGQTEAAGGEKADETGGGKAAPAQPGAPVQAGQPQPGGVQGVDLQVDFSGVTATDIQQALQEAEKLHKLLEGATPAQIELFRRLAQQAEGGVYVVPASEWVARVMEATKGLSPEDLAYIMGLDWTPGHMTAEEMRKAIEQALKQKNAPKDKQPDAAKPGEEPGKGAEPPAEAGEEGAPKADDKARAGSGAGGKGRGGAGAESGAAVEPGVTIAQKPPPDVTRKAKGHFPFRILEGLQRDGDYQPGVSYPCKIQITDEGKTFKVASVQITFQEKIVRREKRDNKRYDIVYFKLYITEDFWVEERQFYGLGGIDTAIEYDFGGKEVR
jgi:hypothetical protein